MPSSATMRLGACCCAFFLISCSSKPLDNDVPAPIESRTTPVAISHDPDTRPKTVTVTKGDTLYSLALEYGHDYRDLAAWNHLSDPNVINVGQSLRLTPPEREPELPAKAAAQPVVTTAPPPAVTRLSQPRAAMLSYSEHALADLKAELKVPAVPSVLKSDVSVNVNSLPSADGRSVATMGVRGDDSAVAKPLAAASAVMATAQIKPVEASPVKVESKQESSKDGAEDDLVWQWPTQGKVVMAFREGSSKGVDIAGRKGQAIFSACVGKVVYSGNGLRGYGKLVIIKHNKTYLSAYAHNQTVLVKEGDTVAKGQKIAEMGDTDSDKVELHFEIRRFGKPVDPIKYLPAETS